MCTSLQKTKCKETLLECWNTNACFQSGWPGILNKDKHGGSTLLAKKFIFTNIHGTVA